MLLVDRDLARKEHEVRRRLTTKTRHKVFYRWFDGYYTKLEAGYFPYTRYLRKRAFAGFREILEQRWRKKYNAHLKHK